jgi:hypothetical protein
MMHKTVWLAIAFSSLGSGCGPSLRPIQVGAKHPALETNDVVAIECTPASGFSECMRVGTFVGVPAETIFSGLSDPRNFSKIFPDLELRPLGDRPSFGPDMIYQVRQEGEWITYHVIGFEENRRLSAETGELGTLERLRYDHRLVPVEGGTILDEQVDYEIALGILDPIANCLFVRRGAFNEMATGHRRLKAFAEDKAATQKRASPGPALAPRPEGG